MMIFLCWLVGRPVKKFVRARKIMEQKNVTKNRPKMMSKIFGAQKNSGCFGQFIVLVLGGGATFIHQGGP